MHRSESHKRILPLLLLLGLTSSCAPKLNVAQLAQSSTQKNLTLTLTSPSSNAILPGYTKVTGTCDQGTSISLAGDVSGSTLSSSCAIDGTFAISFRLTDGQGYKNVTVTASDADGNSAHQSLQLVMPKPSLKGANLFEPCDNYYGQYYMPSYQSNIDWDLDYYKSKGLTLVRLGLGWEYTQPTLNGALTPWVVSCLHYVVDHAAARNMKVIFDLHNYARYVINNNGGQTDQSSAPAGDVKFLGSTDVPNSAFADFWVKMATEFGSSSAIYAYGLMNEPHDMPSPTQWPTSAQAAVTAIRTVDTTTPILVSGDDWGNAQRWASSNGSLAISDPSNKIIYEAHLYFDPYGAGQYTATYDADAGYPMMGVDLAKPFVDWLNQHGYTGFIGEFGVPAADPRWLPVLDNFVNNMAANGIDMTVFSGGFMWDQFGQQADWFNIEPVGASSRPATPVDQPQMSVLQNYPSTY